MKIKFNIVIILLMSCLVSCSSGSAMRHDKKGVAITIPKGWKLTNDETRGELGSYIRIEKSGFSQSGVALFQWIEITQNPQEYLEKCVDGLKADGSLKNIKFEKAAPGKFKNSDALVVKFTFGEDGSHGGTISAFNMAGRTFCVSNQEASKDAKENSEGFRALDQSFVCLNTLTIDEPIKDSVKVDVD